MPVTPRPRERPTLPHALLLPGNVQDRDSCLGVLRAVRRLFPFLERVIADGAYQGRETARAVRRAARARLEIVKRSDAAKGFVGVCCTDRAVGVRGWLA